MGVALVAEAESGLSSFQPSNEFTLIDLKMKHKVKCKLTVRCSGSGLFFFLGIYTVQFLFLYEVILSFARFHRFLQNPMHPVSLLYLFSEETNGRLSFTELRHV